MDLRVGFGYDIHRLVGGRPLRLGGIEIPFGKGLAGHSDGDVASHAVADAMISAAGLGDIGSCFPPGDPAWAGATGPRLLHETRNLLERHQARLVQADITIVAEAPRVADHREAMRRALSGALGCPPEAISIKGRSHEGIGAIGRGEAMAAYAVVLIEVGRQE